MCREGNYGGARLVKTWAPRWGSRRRGRQAARTPGPQGGSDPPGQLGHEVLDNTQPSLLSLTPEWGQRVRSEMGGKGGVERGVSRRFVERDSLAWGVPLTLC